MSFIVHMPKLSPTMEQGTIVRWHVKEGDTITPSQVVIEVATDKATVEHQLIDGGILRRILVKEGSEAFVNQPIAIMSARADDSIEALLAQVEEKKKTISVPVVENSNVESLKESSSASSQSGSVLKGPRFTPFGVIKEESKQDDEGLKSSPYARKIACEKGVDLSSVKGSGPGGRVVAQDVEGASPLNAWKVGFDSKSKPSLATGSFEYESMSPMRRVIATRLQESKTFIPHFYVSLSLEASALSNLQAELKSHGFKISINDLIVKACSLALRKNPKVNSGFDTVENKIIRFQTVDICIAVALAEGLITPVVYQADYKRVSEISKEVKSLVARAQKGELKPQEYQGGSFTVSNLGMFAIDRFSAILNPPQAAILAVGAIQDKPVVKNGAVVAGKVLELTLSVDHRVIDGADAARFLSDLKILLEAPSILLV